MQDAVGQSPDDVVCVGEGWEAEGVGVGVDEDFGDGAAIAQGVDGNPEGRLDLAGVGCGDGIRRHGEDEGGDEDGRDAQGRGSDLVESADERADTANGDGDLLLCFTAGSGQEVGIVRGAASAWEGDVSGPGVTGHFGAADEEELERFARAHEDGHGSFATVG